jgi:hypothetical protein
MMAGFDVVNLQTPELAEPSRSATLKKDVQQPWGTTSTGGLVGGRIGLSPTAFPLVHSALQRWRSTRSQQLAGH